MYLSSVSPVTLVKINDYVLKSKEECDLQKLVGVCPDDALGGHRDLINAKGTYKDGTLSASWFKYQPHNALLITIIDDSILEIQMT